MKKVHYKVTGKSKAGRSVYTHNFTSIKLAVESFVDSFPRFRGEASIKKYISEEICPGIFRTAFQGFEVIDSFESTKEIKETYLA